MILYGTYFPSIDHLDVESLRADREEAEWYRSDWHGSDPEAVVVEVALTIQNLIPVDID